MQLFYFGHVCDKNLFSNTVEKSRVKPSEAVNNFESALIKGFSENDNVDMTIISAESIAAFPNGNRLFLKKRQDVLNENAVVNILPSINLPVIKQMIHAQGAAKQLRKWLKENKNQKDKCVITYGIHTAVIQKLQKICKKHNCKIFGIIPDLLSMVISKDKSWLRTISDAYRRKGILVQGRFDGYIYLTEAMADKVAPGKPYTVMETIADTTVFDEVGSVKTNVPAALMYAGALFEKFGLKLILDTFENIKTDCELWLFGSGDYEGEIARRAGLNPKIKFFGRVSRDEVLKKEQEATLLLNLRNAEDDYTKYSFPSKMIEYMLSGTPVFITKLSGIPEEYYKYCYHTTDYTPEKIAAQIDEVLSEDNMGESGEKARQFVIEQKNAKTQVSRVIKFLEKEIKD